MKPGYAALAGGAVAALAAAALLHSRAHDTVAVPAAAASAASSALSLDALPPPRPLPAPAASTAFTAGELAFIDQLRARFARRLHDPHAQVKAIEQLVAFLRQQHPGDWRGRLRAFLAALFPELAEALAARFEGLERLNEWLGTHREALLRLAPDERRAALWAARRKAFGADAEAIYAGEIRNERLLAALQAADAAANLTMDEKLDRFVAAIGDAYGDQAPGFIASRQTELVNRFVDAPSVQTQLASQAPAERSATLRQIRAALGMDEAAVARWDELDQARDRAWSAGQAYMDERARIVAGYQGDARARELVRLQERHFGAEADTSRAEEEAGFYRYAHPRRHGRE